MQDHFSYIGSSNYQKKYNSLPVAPIVLITSQDFLIFSTQTCDALLKLLVSTSLKASHGVSPVNCQIGAEAAKEL